MINTVRHDEVFNASKYKDKRITIVGLGAIGSRVFEALASTGLTNMQLIDYDTVEDHNLANQLFIRSDIGKSKVDACINWAVAKVGNTAKDFGHIKGKVDLSCAGWFEDTDVVICCVDSFIGRDIVYKMAAGAGAEIFIEAGMATGHCNVFMFNPLNTTDTRNWRKTLGDDNDPSYEVSACGSGLTVGATSTIAGNIIAWNVMNFLKTGYIDKKIRMDCSPFMVSRIDQR